MAYYVHAATEAEQEGTDEISDQVQPEIEKRAVAVPCMCFLFFNAWL